MVSFFYKYLHSKFLNQFQFQTEICRVCLKTDFFLSSILSRHSNLKVIVKKICPGVKVSTIWFYKATSNEKNFRFNSMMVYPRDCAPTVSNDFEMHTTW
jgi:hypothetical protein